MTTFQKLRYKNILSTGDNFIEIDLDRFSTTLILGKNGSGKSTMLDALTFALFGKPFRKFSKNLLVNSINQRGLLVEVEFTIGRHYYMVRRGIKPNVFEIYQDGNFINQDSKVKDYQEHLEQNILKMNYKTFTQVVILGSASYTPFMQLSTNDRRALIEDLLDIQIFSSMNTILKQRMAELKDEATTISQSIALAHEEHGLIERYIESVHTNNQKKIAEDRKKIQADQKRIEEIENDIIDLEDQIAKLREKTDGRDAAEDRLRKHELNEQRIKERHRRVKQDLSFYTDHKDCPTCAQVIADDFRQAAIKDKQDKIMELDEALQKLKDLISGLREQISAIRKTEQQISTIERVKAEKRSSQNALRQYVRKMEAECDEAINSVDLTAEHEKLQAIEQRMNDLEKQREGNADNKHYFEVASVLLKDGGIKTIIVKQYLPIINKLINKYLSAMDFYVSFTLDENFSETIKSRYRDEFVYESFSEGEKMRINIAILMTWRDIARMKNCASTNLLILDETMDSSLDQDGVEYLTKVLYEMNEKTNTFVISQRGAHLTDRFANVLSFRKENNFARMES